MVFLNPILQGPALGISHTFLCIRLTPLKYLIVPTQGTNTVSKEFISGRLFNCLYKEVCLVSSSRLMAKLTFLLVGCFISLASFATPPVVTSGIASSVSEGTTSLGAVTANEPVTWSISGAGVSITQVSDMKGSVTLDTPADYNTAQSHSFATIAKDSDGNKTSTDFIVNVIGTSADNTPPVITTNIASAVNEGLTALGSVTANEPVTWSIAGAGVSITQVSYIKGNVTLDTPADFNTAQSHSFTITATDNAANTASTTELKVFVNDSAPADNTPPVIDTTGLVTSVNEGDTALGSVTANEPVTWSIAQVTGSGAGVSITQEGSVTLDTPADYNTAQSHSFTITASDNAALIASTEELNVAVNDPTPADVTDVVNYMVNAGNSHTCALDDSDNGVTCWGLNNHGQTTVPDSLSNPTQVSAGYRHTCALDDSDNGVICWGWNVVGGTTVPALSNPTQVSAGLAHTCALDNSGVVCWGNNSQFGGHPALSNPTQVSVAENSCALDDTGVVCWDLNRQQVSVPVLSNSTMVSVGVIAACALDDTGVVCWGSNDYGQTDVPLLSNPRQVSVGIFHTCARDDNGVTCWGRNDEGQTTVPNLLIDPDGDGVSDAQESIDGTNPLVADTDGDGLSDGEEAINGTNPLVADTDGDGFSDGDESDIGSDPLDAQSTPSSGLSLLLIKAAIDLKNNTAEKVTQ